MTMHSPRFRAVIVDDEDLARAIIREHLAAHPEIEIVAECRNGVEAVKALSASPPDIVFLDVQMPKLDGFDVLELAPGSYAVVFVTAFDAFAVRAFEVNAADYLLKPFSRERFDAALARACDRVGDPSGSSARQAELTAAARGRRVPLDRILVRDGADVHIIPAEDIDYLEAQDDYVRIHAGRVERVKQERLAALGEALDPGIFVRIHRSYILNLTRLARIEPFTKDSRVAILRDGTRLPVSKSGYERLKSLL